jgi:acetate---CoA ligase (ADP-forming)
MTLAGGTLHLVHDPLNVTGMPLVSGAQVSSPVKPRLLRLSPTERTSCGCVVTRAVQTRRALSTRSRCGRDYLVEARLADGPSLRIRAIAAADRTGVSRLFTELSARSMYLRFFNTKKALSDEQLEAFTQPDFDHHVVLVGALIERGQEQVVALGHYIRDDSRGDSAEVAFAVADAYQGRGLGTLLLEHLAKLARDAGIRTFEADVLGENNRMLDVFAASGFEVVRSFAEGVFQVRLPTEDTPTQRRASARREALADARSLEPLLRPKSVALVGVSRKPHTIGSALLRNLEREGFCGPIFLVNPHVEKLGTHEVYPDVKAIGRSVDLAVIAVPAAVMEATIEDCIAAGVRAAVIISAGFAEVSPEGAALQERILTRIREAGLRVVGPNCMGILNTDPDIRLHATFAPASPPRGNVAMASQSGALGLAILDLSESLGLGLSSFVSLGNRADVSNNDLLAYWGDDPSTNVIVLYLESVGNPRKFARIAPLVARKKPIVAVKSGRSAAGTRAVSSHSASLANRDVAVDALFEQTGVIRTNTLQELFDVATLLSSQPLPQGDRIGIITNAGGPAVLLADACEAQGLSVPELSSEVRARLQSFLPAAAAVGNPVDLIAAATPEQYAAAIQAVGETPEIDALAILHIPPLPGGAEAIAKAIATAVGDLPPHKPVITVFLPTGRAPQALGRGPRGALPCYAFPENAAHALAAARRRARWLARPDSDAHVISPFCRDAVRAIIERVGADRGEPVWLAPADVVAVLGAVGIESATSEVTTPADASEVAERLGYPLVAKLVSRDVLHKTELGGVIGGLGDAGAVGRAARQLEQRAATAGARLDGILLQRHVEAELEALVGVTADPTFGPIVVCGLGGTLVEVLHDVAFRVPPVTRHDAEEMLAGLRANVLLDGFRGRPPADRAAVVDTIMRIAALAEAVPELLDLEVNPLMVRGPGEGVIAVDARIRIGPPSA